MRNLPFGLTRTWNTRSNGQTSTDTHYEESTAGYYEQNTSLQGKHYGVKSIKKPYTATPSGFRKELYDKLPEIVNPKYEKSTIQTAVNGKKTYAEKDTSFEGQGASHTLVGSM
jgi:hypothetical protein